MHRFNEQQIKKKTETEQMEKSAFVSKKKKKSTNLS